MGVYVFREYDHEYPTFFKSEQKRLKEVLGEKVKVEHIGSTAVPGLGGKGILDVLVGVSGSKLMGAKEKLEAAGYEFREKASHPERLFFRVERFGKNGKRWVHVHLVEHNGEEWLTLTGFRDYLLKNPDAVKDYAQIKREGVKKALGDGEVYRKYKRGFIEKVLNKL